MVLHHNLFPASSYPFQSPAILLKTPGCLQNLNAGPVIDRERKLCRLIPRLQSIKQMKRAPAPAVDHLIGISNRKQLRSLCHKAINKFQLFSIAVLYFVNNHPLNIRRSLFLAFLFRHQEAGIFHQI